MTIAAGLAIALGASTAALSDSSMDATVKARQGHMHEIAGAAKTIGDQLQSATPDLAAIRSAAHTLKGLGQDLPGWFPKGSGPESGAKTRAKPEIWTDAATFANDAADFKNATAKLDEVAVAGDPAALKAQMGAMGLTCGACHQAYRGPPIPAAPPPPAS